MKPSTVLIRLDLVTRAYDGIGIKKFHHPWPETCMSKSREALAYNAGSLTFVQLRAVAEVDKHDTTYNRLSNEQPLYQTAYKTIAHNTARYKHA